MNRNRIANTKTMADFLVRARILITCLLRDSGGWWSAPCVRLHALKAMPQGIGTVLAPAVLAELHRDGTVEVRPSAAGPLFRWKQ